MNVNKIFKKNWGYFMKSKKLSLLFGLSILSTLSLTTFSARANSDQEAWANKCISDYKTLFAEHKIPANDKIDKITDFCGCVSQIGDIQDNAHENTLGIFLHMGLHDNGPIKEVEECTTKYAVH